jgi:hypothetical protein
MIKLEMRKWFLQRQQIVLLPEQSEVMLITKELLQVTGATKTFSGTIGASIAETGYALTLIDIDGTSIFNAAVSATEY